MNRVFAQLLVLLLLGTGCGSAEKTGLYTIGVLHVGETPTGRDVLSGFLQALEEGGARQGENIRLVFERGDGDLPRIQRNARDLVAKGVDMIVALSTPSLQAALHVSGGIPVLFSSVANPYLAGAGFSAEDHLENVTGVSSRGPIRQTLEFIHELLPDAKRIGTLWTPSELNSNFYLERTRIVAAALGLDVVALPVSGPSDVLLSGQMLVNRRIDVLYPISDNTINSVFEALGLVAEENGVPLFASFLHAAQLGACAALGWDFHEMGYKAGRLALRIKNGESPRDLPFQNMTRVQLHINPETARRQGVFFPREILERADRVFHADEGEIEKP